MSNVQIRSFIFLSLLAAAVLLPSALVDLNSAKAADVQGVSKWAIDISTIVKDARHTKRSAIAPAQVFPGKGTIVSLERSNVVAGQVNVYETSRERISITLVEYRQRQWAVSGTTYKKATPLPQAAPGASFGWVRTATLRGLGVVGTKGRVGIEIWVGVPTGSKPTESEQLDLAKALYSRQFAAVPMLPDLKSSAAQIGQQFAERLGIGVLLAGLMLSAAGWLVGWCSDAGSRELLFNRHRGDRSRSGVVDITPMVRRGLMRRSLVPVARISALAGVEGILLAMPGVRVTASFIMVAAFVAVWGLFESRLRRRHAKGPVAHGRGAAIVTGLGATASVLVVTVGLAVLSAAVSATLLVQGWTSARIWVPMLLLGFAIISWSRRPIRLTRRLLQPLVRQQIEADARRPILLLRSFQDDALEVRPPSAAAGTWDGFAEEPYVRFEEVVAWEAWQFGWLRTAGQPGTVLQPLGAVRDYYSDSDWQEAVEKGAQDARAIVLVVGRSPGLVWEIGNLRAHGRLAKTVFVIPPVPPKETARRLAVLASALELDPAQMIQPGDGRTPLALTFNEDGRPLIYAVAGRTSDAYWLALGLALAAIPERPVSITGPARDFHRASADVTEHLVTFDPQRQPRPRKPLITRLANAALWLVPI